jgi:hypothetical protein
MAKEPESLVLRLLRDMCGTQQSHRHMLEKHGDELDRLCKRIEE